MLCASFDLFLLPPARSHIHETECALLVTEQKLFPSFYAPSVLFDQGAMQKERKKMSTGQGRGRQEVRRKPGLEMQTLILGVAWIIPLFGAQRTLGRLRSESRNEIRSRKPKENKRVTSWLFFPGDFKSYNTAWRRDARKWPESARSGSWRKVGTFQGFYIVQTSSSGLKRRQKLQATLGNNKDCCISQSTFCSVFLRKLNPFQAGIGYWGANDCQKKDPHCWVLSVWQVTK